MLRKLLAQLVVFSPVFLCFHSRVAYTLTILLLYLVPQSDSMCYRCGVRLFHLCRDFEEHSMNTPIHVAPGPSLPALVAMSAIRVIS
jgi:hypothetical protein